MTPIPVAVRISRRKLFGGIIEFLLFVNKWSILILIIR